MTKLVRGLNNILSQKTGCVITMGNFDGVHRGHHVLLARVKAVAKTLHLPSIVMTFEPQPLEFFSPKKAVARLTRCREKFCLLADCGIDSVLVVHFNAVFAALSAEEFIKKILCEQLGVKYIIVGDDFRFGRARKGDVEFLKKAGERYHFTVETLSTVALDGEKISSTRIRQALAEGNHPLAEKLLGRPYSMMGRVVYGNQLGRVLGFPTANIYLHRVVTPVQGIYAVRVYGLEDHALTGVANLGTRPTIGGTRILLEVHLFHFDRVIYGKYVTVEFCKKLREEKRFDNLDLLKEQIGKDADEARDYFLQHHLTE
ncbi:MAG TPA: bifunctional riboflavin kinase/FAD synthetase [Gammaproteobacteria bacterium]|nr:bifunctional riboflavin kinase/FAD synthetase [Gammaproteobacteria bacterium]